MNVILAAAAGGAIGATGRFLVGKVMLDLMGPGYPWGTFTVNILGSFLIGFLLEFFAFKFSVSHDWQVFLIVGLLGGFTTFSAFSLEVGLMLQKNEFTSAAIYALSSVVLGLIALFAGMYTGKAI